MGKWLPDWWTLDKLAHSESSKAQSKGHVINTTRAYDRAAEIVLEGFRDHEEALGHAEAMGSDKVFFDALGRPIGADTVRDAVKWQRGETYAPERCPFCWSRAQYEGQYSVDGEDAGWVEGWVCQGDCGRQFEVYRAPGDHPPEEPKKALFDTDGWSNMRVGRLEKCLAREYRFSDGVATLRKWLDTHDLTHKKSRVRKYARKKTHGVHKKLKRPKTEYTVWTGDTGIQIPKTVWDALTVPLK